MKERILIDQDDKLISSILGDISQFQAPLQKLLNSYAVLNLGEMTPAVFNEIKSGNARLSVMRYEKALNDDLDRTKVYNPTLRRNLLAGTEVASREFLIATKQFLATEVKPIQYDRRDLDPNAKLSIDFVSFEDGSLYVSDESREAIAEEHCRFYIETDEEHELFGVAKSIAEGFKKVIAFDKKYNMSLNTNSLQCISFLFADIGPDITVNGRGISGLSKRMTKFLKYRS
jgi:hypothetical protein